MPTHSVHRRLTAYALAAVPDFFAGHDFGMLIEKYCVFPDLAVAGDPEARRFGLEEGGVPFHYLPDSPLENLYRHYRCEPDGSWRRSRPFVNLHYEFAQKGLEHFLRQILIALQENRFDDAMKSTGTLLHVLQDNSFGVHALEGLGGVDVFFFDRLNLWPESPFKTLCRIDCGNMPPVLPRTPQALGSSQSEAVLRIYRHWCDAIGIGRSCCVKFLLERDCDISRMTIASVLLCADVLQTLQSLYKGKKDAVSFLALSEMEPYEPPSRGIERTAEQSLAFQVTAEEHLIYRFPTGLLKALTVEVSLTGGNSLNFELLNDGRAVQSGIIISDNPVKLEIDLPRNECGFKFYAKTGAAGIILKHPILQYAAPPECLPLPE